MINMATRSKTITMAIAGSTTRKTISIRRVWSRLPPCTSSSSRCRETVMMTTQMRKTVSETHVVVMTVMKRTWKAKTGRMTTMTMRCTCRSTQI